MLVGKEHAGGGGSCWWERIMLVLQDDEECKNVISAPTKISFFTERTPVCPFATQITASYMSSRRLPFPIKNSAGKRTYVKVTSKTYFIQVLPNLFPQQYCQVPLVL